MAKAASPIRLQENIMQHAELTAKRFHRSTAEQIEYWADLGRSVSSVLDPDVLLSVLSGVTVIKTEAVITEPIESTAVFDRLESDRQSGMLSDSITSRAFSYQASGLHPGYLEQIDLNGNKLVGQFENGQFKVIEDLLL